MELESVTKLTKDLKVAARVLTVTQARFLVDAYYMMQENRKRSDSQIRSLAESNEPAEVLDWFSNNFTTLEHEVAVSLDLFSDSQPLGKWARSQIGIGPIISAGLLAHIDLTNCKSAGQIWRFAGLDPTSKWLKGQKRPWNASLKTLCWKIGESFMKVSGKEDAFYGQVYKKRKQYEIRKNENGDYAPQAEEILKTRNIGKTTEAYKAYIAGRLPDGQILARSKRYAAKLFLAHYFEIGFEMLHGVKPEKPYPIAMMGHGASHYIAPPHPVSH